MAIGPPEQLEDVGPDHPQALVHPVRHRASNCPPVDRAGLSTLVSHIKLAFKEICHKVEVPSIFMLRRSARPENWQ